jgi:hypothetical protein
LPFRCDYHGTGHDADFRYHHFIYIAHPMIPERRGGY